MSENRKKLSGYEYKRMREEKARKKQDVLHKTSKLDKFFKPEKTECTANNIVNEQQTLFVSKDTNEVAIPSTSNVTVITDSEPCEVGTLDFILDPSDWVSNNCSVDYIISKQGFKQDVTQLDFSKSKLIYSDQSRYCPSSVFTRRLWNGEVKSREWIIYSEKTGRLFCAPCLLFKNTDSKFGSSGFNDWKNVHSRAQEHENSKSHKTCVFNFIFREKELGRIDSAIQKQMNEETAYWRNVLRRVIAVVKTLTSRGLPLRGAEEKFGVTHNGNFLMCIELLAEFDPFLADHIARYGGKGSGSTSYLSSTIYEEIIDIMAKKVVNFIVEDVRKAKYFSVVVDSTPDISHYDQLSVIVRYVTHDESLPVERFLTFLSNVGHKGQDMFNALTIFLGSLHIDMKNCRGQSYDNAANMSGVYTGLQAKIKQLSPQAYYVPCSAHSLNLVGEKASECCLEASNFFSLLQELYNFFGQSTTRWNILESYCQENSNSRNAALKSLSTTRWSARDDACKTLRGASAEIYKALKFFEDDPAQKSATKTEARALRQKLERFETAFMIVLWGFLLERINAVNKSLQKVETTITQTIEMFDGLIAVIESARHKFDEYEQEAQKICILQTVQYEIETRRKKVRKLQADETRANEINISGRDTFRIYTYVVIMDCLITELRARRQAYQEFSIKFSFLDVRYMPKMDSNDVRRKADHLRISYPDDLDAQLEDELAHFIAHCASKEVPTFDRSSILKLYNWFNEMNLKTIYPNIDIVFRLCLCTPATNCSAERSFSSLKRVKNYLRSTIGQERLSAMGILHIESDLVKSLDFEDIVHDFALKKSRKKALI